MYRQHYPNDPGMHNMPAAYNSRASPYRDYNMSTWDVVKRSFVAIIIGVFILTIASGLVFWNEGRAVQTSRSLAEGLRAVRILHSTEVVFEENNAKLVHLSGKLKTPKVLHDPVYKVAVHAVKLRRTVEMYQWVETERRREMRDGDDVYDEVTYDYDKEWRTDLIRSSSFNNRLHVNPEQFLVEPQMYVSEEVQVGNFFLDKSLIEKVANFYTFHPSEPLDIEGVQLHNNMYYHSQYPQDPQIGDARVTFEFSGLSGDSGNKLGEPEVVSILARQAGHQLGVYQTEAGDDLQLLYHGHHSAQHMIGKEQMSNTMLLWGLRFVGWLLMFIGFGCLTTFVTTMAESVPLLRELVILGSVSFSLTMSISLSLTVIGLGWIWYRPYLGLTILALAGLPFIISRLRYQRSLRYRPV